MARSAKENSKVKTRVERRDEAKVLRGYVEGVIDVFFCLSDIGFFDDIKTDDELWRIFKTVKKRLDKIDQMHDEAWYEYGELLAKLRELEGWELH